MAKHPDVAIVGGGIIGLTSAYFLAKEGLAVEVFDRGEFGKEASWAGAGILPPGNPAGAATPIDRCRAIGSVRFPGFSDELRELTGIDNGYLRCGGIEFLAADEVGEVLELWTSEGIEFERLSAHAALRASNRPSRTSRPNPIFSPAVPRFAIRGHLRALIAACEQVGVRLHPHSAVEFIEPDAAAQHPRRLGLVIAGTVAGAGADPDRGGTVERDADSRQPIKAVPAFIPFAGRSCF